MLGFDGKTVRAAVRCLIACRDGLKYCLLQMTLPEPVKRYTPQEYYHLERGAPYKSDYYKGEIFAMAGGTARHSLIETNIIRELSTRLKGTPCATHGPDLRLKIKAGGLRVYPDASVYCSPLQYDEEDPFSETATNPTLLVEVLSPSTEAYDRGLKSASYRQIESLQAFLIVWQESPHVEWYERQSDGSWALREETRPEASVHLRSLCIDLPLAEIYDRVDFCPASEA